MKTMDRNWTAYVSSDVYAGSVNEDGERPDELAFFVVCENERGDRFRSNASFTTEDFRAYYVGDLKVQPARQKAEVLLQKVEAALEKGLGDPSTSNKWHATYPLYTSKAYELYGQADEVAWEKAVG